MATPQDGFATFANGDVRIVLSPGRQLKLHKDVLGNASLLLKKLLTNENRAILSEKTKAEGDNVRYQIDLVCTNTGKNPIGFLRAIKLDTKGRPIDDGANRADMAWNTFGKDSSTLLDDWFNVIGSIYGRGIKFGSSSDGLEALLQRADVIADIFEYLELNNNEFYAPLEVALVDLNQTLWRAVFQDPIDWLNLALRIKSVPVFREAVIHLIGMWDKMTSAQKNELNPKVYELCRRKVEKFKTYKKTVENQILAYKPVQLRYEQGVDAVKGKRDHQPHVFVWIAFSGFQFWLCKAFRDGMGVDGQDGGFKLFKLFNTGGEAYYDRHEQSVYAGCSGPGRAVVSGHINEMKKDLKKIVAKAMQNPLRLDIRLHDIGHFACFDIEQKHCPWVINEKPAPKVTNKPAVVVEGSEVESTEHEEMDNEEAVDEEQAVDHDKVLTEARDYEDEDMEDVEQLNDGTKQGGETEQVVNKTATLQHDYDSDSDSLFVP